jgi:C-5 cytosine-specific DNA methylase
MKDSPLAIDLFCGLGGWTEGLLAEGYQVVGFDNERHVYGEARYPAQLVIQDVLTLHGRQFKDAALIVASPPCQAYSYRAMPWKRAKALPPPDNSLFEACFRLQDEACAAAGRFILLVVENVCGAQKWVGRARWHYGSFYLWGDVPALMPLMLKPHIKVEGRAYIRDGHSHTRHLTNQREHYGIKVAGNKLSENGFAIPVARQIDKSLKPAAFRLSDDDRRQHLSYSRKAASAHIAKIPYELARHIARAWKPGQEQIA